MNDVTSALDRIDEVLEQVSDDDGPVMTQVRKVANQLSKQARIDQARIAELEETVKGGRTSAVKEALIDLGLPSLSPEVLDGRIEGEPTEESVKAALEAAGIPYGQSVSQPEGDGDNSPEADANDLEKVVTAGDAVNEAASAQEGNVMSRLGETETLEDIVAIMAETDELS